jgi:predicted dienelactone hydrolase
MSDTARSEPLAKEPRFREFMVDVWYPAQHVENAAKAPYLDPALFAEAERVANLRYYLRNAIDFLKDDLVQTYALQAVPFSQELAARCVRRTRRSSWI